MDCDALEYLKHYNKLSSEFIHDTHLISSSQMTPYWSGYNTATWRPKLDSNLK